MPCIEGCSRENARGYSLRRRKTAQYRVKRGSKLVRCGTNKGWGALDKDEMVKVLGLFLALEIEQVNLYQVQAGEAAEEHAAAALRRFAEIEQGHVDNISAALRELGGEPGLLVRVSPALGKLAGRITEVAGLVNLLRANILIETVAARHYRSLLERTEEPRLRDLLWKNLIDEELHRAWMIDKVNELTEGARASLDAGPP